MLQVTPKTWNSIFIIFLGIMKISETFFFDLDGPILDVSTKYYQIYVDIVKELSGTPISKEAYWQNKRNKVPESTTLIASDLHLDDLSYYQKIRKEKISRSLSEWTMLSN